MTHLDINVPSALRRGGIVAVLQSAVFVFLVGYAPEIAATDLLFASLLFGLFGVFSGVSGALLNDRELYCRISLMD